MDEEKRLKKELQQLEWKYEDLLYDYKKLERKYFQEKADYQEMIKHQIELGTELEARIKELEGGKNG